MRRCLLVLALLVPIFLVGCASRGMTVLTTAANGALEELPATLYKPEGPGPFPAVVIMHDCSGLGPASSGAPRRWSKELLQRGYVVLLPDSYSGRGYPHGLCNDPQPERADVSPMRRVRDAYAALAQLRRLPYVDRARIGLMGGSHGGLATLASVSIPEGPGFPNAADRRDGFRAGVALYPGCTARIGGWRADGSGVYRSVAPVLILVGAKDDWTPAEPCRELTDSARKAGYPVSIKVYPNAHHSFDSDVPERYVATRVNDSAPSGRGATTAGDPVAWKDSIGEVGAFFDRYLR